jgi:polyhydroxyalkanoate synthesis regulator phasin
MANKEQYYWNKKSECFDGKKFGEDVTKYFAKDEERRKKYLDLGKIVTSEPVDFDQAKENELNSLRKTVKELQLRVQELESEIKKSGSAKLKEAREKITELETQISELTDPGGNDGK